MKTPRFDGLAATSATASRIKSSVRSRDTLPELLLRRALWRQGLRYRLHVKHLRGKPDLVFARERVIVFCDGDFWHGHQWPARRRKLLLGANASYWIAKIETNMERDQRNTKELRAQGWLVIRVWESEISADAEGVALAIAKVLANRRDRRSRSILLAAPK